MPDESDNAELERRITDLEIKVAYQESTIEELDRVVREYADRFDVLYRQLQTVQKSMHNMSEVGPASDKPPHY